MRRRHVITACIGIAAVAVATLAALTALTGQNFGKDFSKWQAWWISQNTDQSFDWTSHLGFAPRVTATQRN